MRYCITAACDGSIILETGSHTRAMMAWDPGTWLGQGKTEKQARDDAQRQYDRHFVKVGDYVPLRDHRTFARRLVEGVVLGND